jgi:peptidoglycan-associated lipoprotein
VRRHTTRKIIEPANRVGASDLVPGADDVLSVTTVVLFVVTAGCGPHRTPMREPSFTPSPALVSAPPPVRRLYEDLPVAIQPSAEEPDPIANRSLDDLNRDSPLRTLFFRVDSADLDDVARATAAANAELLKRYSGWVISVEGHCDERGTSEYNVALGMRRALAAKIYLISLGIDADRIHTVSFGKEFPLIEGHNEVAWSKSRRTQFVITSK